ncbi:MAG: DUF2911 domain-containing protein [Gemmatimonadaceae bacterium]
MRDIHGAADLRRALATAIVAIGASAIASFAQPLAAQTTARACETVGSRDSLALRPSPLDSTTVMVGNREVKVCYSRPRARGRVIFGQLIPYDSTWRTGANEPTMVFLPDTMEIAGVRLGPGRYIITTIPARDEWTLLLSTTSEKDPARVSRALEEVGRAKLPVRALSTPVEQFTIRSDSASGASALVFEWERTQVTVPIRVAGTGRR